MQNEDNSFHKEISWDYASLDSRAYRKTVTRLHGFRWLQCTAFLTVLFQLRSTSILCVHLSETTLVRNRNGLWVFRDSGSSTTFAKNQTPPTNVAMVYTLYRFNTPTTITSVTSLKPWHRVNEWPRIERTDFSQTTCKLFST